MGDALSWGFGEGDGRLHRIRAGLSTCNHPPTENHEANKLWFVSTVDDEPIDNTDFELHNVDAVRLQHDRVFENRGS